MQLIKCYKSEKACLSSKESCPEFRPCEVQECVDGKIYCETCNGEGTYEVWTPLAHGETDVEYVQCTDCNAHFQDEPEDCEECEGSGFWQLHLK